MTLRAPSGGSLVVGRAGMTRYVANGSVSAQHFVTVTLQHYTPGLYLTLQSPVPVTTGQLWPRRGA